MGLDSLATAPVERLERVGEMRCSMLALLAKYKLMVVVAGLLGALGLGGAGVAAAHGVLPMSLSAALRQPSSHVGHARPGAAAHGKRGPHGGLIHGSVITSVN